MICLGTIWNFNKPSTRIRLQYYSFVSTFIRHISSFIRFSSRLHKYLWSVLIYFFAERSLMGSYSVMAFLNKGYYSYFLDDGIICNIFQNSFIVFFILYEIQAVDWPDRDTILNYNPCGYP